jgi:hypothetical protein
MRCHGAKIKIDFYFIERGIWGFEFTLCESRLVAGSCCSENAKLVADLDPNAIFLRFSRLFLYLKPFGFTLERN